MIGPGAPNSQNSGLGVASDHFARNLSKYVNLNIIEPGDELNSEVGQASGSIDSFNQLRLIRDIIRIQIKSSMNPYVYAFGEVETEVETELSTLQLEFSQYSQELIHASSELDFDVIYAHDWISIEAALAIKKAAPKPLVLHIHSLDFDRSGGITDSWIFQLEKKGLEMADSIIAVSEYTKGIMVDVYEIDSKKIHVVHNGVEPHSVKRKKKFKEPLVAFIGRLTAQKGASQFLDIATKVAEEIPDTRFVVVGDGDLRDQLIGTGAYDRLGTRLHFTGHLSQEEKDQVLSMSDVLCMPSVSEPFGLTALEAAAAGVPVVISSSSGVSEILSKASILDPDDLKGFSDGILHLIGNPKEAQRQIAANTKSIKASLGWKIASEKVVKVLTDSCK